MKADVIIVGAGVLGLSLAYHLSKEHHSKEKLSVIVLEREISYAQHASGKNAGMFRQLYRHPQLTEWALRSRLSWPVEVRKKFFKGTGSLIVGRTHPGHHDELFYEDLIDVNSQDETITLAAIQTPTDGVLDPAGYISALYSLIDDKSVKFLFNEQVSAITNSSIGWEVKTSSGHSYSSTWLVNAAGAWLNRFFEPSLPHLTVSAQPYVRHLFVLTGWPKRYMPAPSVGFYWDEYSGWYMRVWDETSRLASICDRLPANPELFVSNDSVNEELSQTLLSAMPDIAPLLSLSHRWHCFRTYTEDQLPIWGEDSRAPGLFWLAAFGGFGMSTSFAASKDAADYLVGRATKIEEDFLPQRVASTTNADLLVANSPITSK